MSKRKTVEIKIPVSSATLRMLEALDNGGRLGPKASKKKLARFLEGAVEALALGSLPAMELKKGSLKTALDETYARRLRAVGRDETQIRGFLAARRHYGAPA